MPNPKRIADKNTDLGHDAETLDDRRLTLEWCLNNPWAAADIGRIERSETTRFHGWLMWSLEALNDETDTPR